MGLFKKDIGTFVLNYLSLEEVNITDRIPDPNQRQPVTLSFPFMLSSKLLFDFPPPGGSAALDIGYSRLIESTKGKSIDESDISFLGIFCDTKVKILENRVQAKWEYSAAMFEKGGGFGIEIDIPLGNEEHFHKASIDVVWEHFKRRWDLGPILVAFAQEFFKRLQSVGIENLSASYETALETAREMSSILAGKFI